MMKALDATRAPVIITGGPFRPDATGTSSASPAPAKYPKKKSRRQKHQRLPEPCCNKDVVLHDVAVVLGKEAVDLVVADGSQWGNPFEMKHRVEVKVNVVASNGMSFVFNLLFSLS